MADVISVEDNKTCFIFEDKRENKFFGVRQGQMEGGDFQNTSCRQVSQEIRRRWFRPEDPVIDDSKIIVF